MLLLGHAGITAGIVKIGDILSSMNRPLDNCYAGSSAGDGLTIPKKLLPFGRRINGIRRQLGSIDYRLVLLGSLLPDIIDKPLWLAFSDVSLSGRDYGHTFLFNIVLLICGLLVVKYRKSWLLTISLSSIMHLILDQMWTNPVTLWWPLLGPLQREEVTGWMSDIIQRLSSNPGTYVPEIIGLIIILLIGYGLIVRKNSIKFIRTGVID